MGLYEGSKQLSFGDAVSAFKSGEVDQAKDILKTVIITAPKNHEALDLLAIISVQKKDFKSAIKFSKQALTIEKKSSRYVLNHAIALALSGKTKKALSILVKFTIRYPKSGSLVGTFGDFLLGSHQFEKAILVFGEASKTTPNDPEIYKKLGIAYQYLEKFTCAQDSYNKAILAGSTSADIHFNLGSINLRAGNTEPAILAFQKALSIDPNHYQSLQSIGHELSRVARYLEAVPFLQKAISINPSDHESICELANALAITEQTKQSIEVCESALKQFPDQLNLVVQSAFSFFIGKEYSKSLSMCRKAVKINPGNISALAFLASTLNELGERKEASRILDFDYLIQSTVLKPTAPFASVTEFNDALEATIYAHPTLEVKESNRSLSRGKCTSNLFDGNESPSLIHLKEKIYDAFDKYVSTRPVDPTHPFLFRHPSRFSIYCWANIIDEGGFHDVHFHPTGWLSGVYYPKLPNEVNFPNHGSSDGFLEFGKAYYRLLSSDDPPVHRVKPREGLMVLSPSYFGHRTIPFRSKEKRISIAFDIIPEEFAPNPIT